MLPLWMISQNPCSAIIEKHVFNQAPVVQKVDSTLHWINLYPMDNPIGFPNTYPLDRGLSSG